jgi:hypothetical protein
MRKTKPHCLVSRRGKAAAEQDSLGVVADSNTLVEGAETPQVGVAAG